MKKWLTYIFILTAFVTRGQSIPWASQQPEWVFTFIFEDGLGDRDTLYYGYSQAASPQYFVDSLLGEYTMPEDTSTFFASWGAFGNLNRLGKAYVTDSAGLKDYVSITFNKGVRPLKIIFDVLKFNESTLPYFDQSPNPKGIGILYYDTPFIIEQDSGCFGNSPAFLSNNYYCGYTDTIIMDNWWNEDVMPNLEFRVFPWDDFIPLKANQQVENDRYYLYPNPVSETLFIKPDKSFNLNWEIFNVEGVLIQSCLMSNDEVIDVSKLTNGYYLLKVNSESGTSIKPFIKLK